MRGELSCPVLLAAFSRGRQEREQQDSAVTREPRSCLGCRWQRGVRCVDTPHLRFSYPCVMLQMSNLYWPIIGTELTCDP